MSELLDQNAPGLIYVAGSAIALLGAWTLYDLYRRVRQRSRLTRTWTLAVLALLTLLVGGSATWRAGEGPG